MTRPTFSDFKTKALANPEVRSSYDELELAYDLRKKFIALRKNEGIAQDKYLMFKNKKPFPM